MLGRRPLLAAPAALAASPARGQSLPPIGLQLYTVRTLLERDYEGTLLKISGLGYRTVEFAGLYPSSSPRQTLAMLKRCGLAAPSGHAGQEELEGDLAGALRTAHALEQQFIVCPSVDAGKLRTLDDWKRLAARFNRIGAEAQRAGLTFAYHNHDFEFRPLERQAPYDVLLAETDPVLVRLELDLYWMARARRDPLAYFRKYPGRFSLVHLKDMDAAGEITELGRGTIDFRRILGQAGQAGIVHCFVEHDDPQDPLRSIETSLRAVRQITSR
jgi:sugar phosphate isomerase/epimerase